MTAMLVQFKDGAQYAAPDEFVPGEWYEAGNEGFQLAYRTNCEAWGKKLEDVKAAWLQRKGKKDGDKGKDKEPEEESESDPEVDEDKEKKEREERERERARSEAKRATKKEEGKKEEGKESPLPQPKLKGSNRPSPSPKRATVEEVQEEKKEEKKDLAWFAARYGGQQAKAAILAATGLVLGNGEPAPSPKGKRK